MRSNGPIRITSERVDLLTDATGCTTGTASATLTVSKIVGATGATPEASALMRRTKSAVDGDSPSPPCRSEEHTSELQSQSNLVCRLLLEKKLCRQLHEQEGHFHSLSTQRSLC